MGMQKKLRDILDVILEIQELDMQMIQLMRLKKERQKELDHLGAIKRNLGKQVADKQHHVLHLKQEIKFMEEEVAEIQAKGKRLDAQQSSIKKIDEFNALTQEMAQVERERLAKEHKLSDAYDRLATAEDGVKVLRDSLHEAEEGSRALEEEIYISLRQINTEGSSLKLQREELAQNADPEILQIYQRLLNNKRDRVVVPIENRCCSGCHIVLTAQHENLVRKGERMVFCEHCSRIHYWQESAAGDTATAKIRRRRTAKTS